MEQNFIINYTNEATNNLYSDVSNTIYRDNITNQLFDISSLYVYTQPIFRPNLFIPIALDTSSSYLQNFIYSNTISDLSHIRATSINNNSNYPRAITLRDLLRTLYLNYYEEDESTSLETFINSTFDNKAKFKKVISDNELEKLIPQKFNKSNETETNIQCPILYYNFEENEEIIKLPCNHNYNCEAITKWLSQESNTCPVCRYEFDYKEINIDKKAQTTTQTTAQTTTQTTAQTTTQTTTQEEEYMDHEEEYEYMDHEEETRNIYSLFSSEEILMQEILLNSYSNNNH